MSLKSTKSPKKLRPSKNQSTKPRWSMPSARKERQKYTSDEYRNNYEEIQWNKKTGYKKTF